MVTKQQMFNPGNENYETLRTIVVEREDDLEDILGRLTASPINGTSHNFITVAPRGMGKTHFLLLVYHEIKNRKELNEKYISFLFSEEEYSIDSLAYFFIRILDELSKEWNIDNDDMNEEISKFREKMDELDNKELVTEADRFLEDFFGKNNKKIVLCVDNIDEIFERISSERTGLKQLRSILQSKNYLLLVGAAPTFFSEVKNHNKPFYNFFEIIRLSTLTREGVEKMIRKLAEMERHEDFLKNFDHYKPRIQTVVHFTGGVPRLIRMLYFILINSEVTQMADYLEKLLDELTPYYQARMAKLSPQQRKIVDTMASLDGPSTPTEIAKAGRMKRSIVNAQLKKLADNGFVHLIQQGKKKWKRYDITERMFRIWREMRRGKGGYRVRYLADFLKAFYTEKELLGHVKKLDRNFSKCIENGEFSNVDGHLREYEIIKPAIPKKMLPDFEMGLIDKYLQVDKPETARKELEYLKEIQEDMKIKEESAQKIYDLELKIIEKTLEKNPEDVDAQLEKANYYFQDEKYSEALEVYENILMKKPRQELALLGQAIIFHLKNQYEESMKGFDEVLEINSKNETAILLKGHRFFTLGNYEQALEIFDNGLEFYPNNIQLVILKGQSLFLLEKYDLANIQFEKALEIIPENEDALFFIGLYHFLRLDYDLALERFNEILTINSTSFRTLSWKGRVCHILGSFDEALQSYDLALSINPTNVQTLFWKADFLMEKKQYGDTIILIDNILDVEPDNNLAFLLRADMNFNLEMYEDAITDYDEILKNDPKNELALIDKGNAFLNLEKYDDAIKTLNTILEFNPKSEYALCNSSEAYGYLNKYNEAIKLCKKLLKINSSHEEAQKNLGLFFIQGNKVDSFFKWFNKLGPENQLFMELFKDIEFYYEFEYKNAMTFLSSSQNQKNRSPEFSQFWDDLLRFTISQIIEFSVEDFESKNYGKSRETLGLLFRNRELWKDKDLNSLFLEYFVKLISYDLPHAEETFAIFNEKLDDDFRNTFITLDKTIEYLKIKDEELLEKLFPEEREVVEKLVEKIEKCE